MRIISGAQTGADRGGLDAAIKLGLIHGGFVPKGRRAEDGVIPTCYSVVEMATVDYPERTAANIRAAHATLILHHGTFEPGTKLTKRIARELGKPHLILNIFDDSAALVLSVREWLAQVKPEILNVAGSRESRAPGIQARTCELLVAALREVRE